MFYCSVVLKVLPTPGHGFQENLMKMVLESRSFSEIEQLLKTCIFNLIQEYCKSDVLGMQVSVDLQYCIQIYLQDLRIPQVHAIGNGS